MLRIQPICPVLEGRKTMPLSTVAGSASLLGPKTARVCFHQLSFPTFSNAEVLLILSVLSFQLKPGEGASEVSSKISQQADSDTASRYRAETSFAPPCCAPLAKPSHLSVPLGYQEGTGPILAAPPTVEKPTPRCPPTPSGQNKKGGKNLR